VPELPEVETIRRQLAPLVEGRRLRRLEILDPRWSRPLAPAELSAALQGRRIERLERRGKYLLWSFQGDVHLAQHLRMTGAVLWEPRAQLAHERVRLELAPGGRGVPRARR
jgi:formamidopyrimidine-DNA glycosylase